MLNNIGRNDPCSCGSGKKHKKCCLGNSDKSGSLTIVDFEWRKLRKLEGTVVDKHLTPYIMDELPSDVIQQAMVDIALEDLPEEIDKKLFFNNFFLQWFLFNWIPEDDFGVNDFAPEETVSKNYFLAHNNLLTTKEKKFIEVIQHTYYSFYVVQEVVKSKSIQVKDILLGTTHEVKENSGTEYLKRGHIVFSRILTMDNQSIFIGMAPVTIPNRYHNDIIDYRDNIIIGNNNQPLKGADLREFYNEDLVDYFFNILKSSYDRKPATLTNTDGDYLQPSKSSFKLKCLPIKAFNLLRQITMQDNIEGFLSDAKRDKKGEVTSIEFPWIKKGNNLNKSWDNTILGHIKITSGKIVLETNSENRTQKGKLLLLDYLGDEIKFQSTVIESIHRSMNELPKKNVSHSFEQQELMDSPEAQEHLKELAKKHWDSWFETPIPDLGNKTPKEAATTPKGQERLNALLLDYESRDNQIGKHALTADIKYLRAELKLSNDL